MVLEAQYQSALTAAVRNINATRDKVCIKVHLPSLKSFGRGLSSSVLQNITLATWKASECTCPGSWDLVMGVLDQKLLAIALE